MAHQVSEISESGGTHRPRKFNFSAIASILFVMVSGAASLINLVNYAELGRFISAHKELAAVLVSFLGAIIGFIAAIVSDLFPRDK